MSDLRSGGYILEEGGIDARGSWPTQFLLDFPRGGAGEGAAVVYHAGREFGEGEGGGGDAGLDGEEDMLLVLRSVRHVIWLEDYLGELVVP